MPMSLVWLTLVVAVANLGLGFALPWLWECFFPASVTATDGGRCHAANALRSTTSNSAEETRCAP
jgi:hypothetical protein